MSLLAADRLAIGYGPARIAGDIDLTLAAGSVTCLLGPNGAGKTTLFKTLLGLIEPLAGTIRLGNDPLAGLPRHEIARRIAYVPQSIAGGFAETVLDLVLMGRTPYVGAFGVPRAADIAIAKGALDTLGIAHLADREASRVSGGQRQLALIARALAQQARIIVMDEPTASLDLGNRLLVLDCIAALAADGIAVLLSTHEPEQAFAVADVVAILWHNRPFQLGAPATILTGETLSALYGVPLEVEQTPTGRHVVGATRRHKPGFEEQRNGKAI
jgi:iron complex transport system ATP-binding protein